MKRLLLGFICFFSLMNIYKADCTYSEVKKLNTLASFVTSDYEYNESTSKFDLVLTNVPSDLYVTINSTQYAGSDDRLVIPGFDYGKSIDIYIYASSSSECVNESLRIIKFTFPYLNTYYQSEACINRENLDVCKYKFLPYQISQNTFYNIISRDDKEKNELNEKENEENKNDSESEVVEEESLLDKIEKYGFSIAIPVLLVVLSSIVTFLIGKKIEKRIERKIKHGL